ncbi:hypothetical protein [Anoxybacillus flavithermus]|uniref:hypothetical protein n=1 Tax=Anoxybacillus flavithermus TaxID=33934 RepID=UPI00059F9307|nr:hypothetical protein [Anoxybacillus flavithermus]
MEASRVERHILYPTHPYYHMFDEYCFRAKNVYNQLQYKGEQHGIRVIVTEESYTSKCSF